MTLKMPRGKVPEVFIGGQRINLAGHEKVTYGGEEFENAGALPWGLDRVKRP